MNRTRPAVLAAAALSLGACVSVPRDAGVAEVQAGVRARTNQTVRWGASEDDAGVRALLEAELTADSAVAIALARSPRLQVTLAELGIARADLLQASTVRNPLLELELRFPPAPFHPFEIRIAQTLVDLLQLSKHRAIGRAAFDAAQMRVSSAVLRFAGEVRAAYYELLAASRHVIGRGTILESAQAAADLAMKQHGAGNITDLDLENEQALYEEAKLGLARVEKRLLLAREALGRHLGVREPLAARLPERFPELPRSEPDQAGLEAIAAEQRLDLAIARRELEIAERRIPLSRLAALGELTLDGHLQRDADGTRTVGPGLEIPIPLFDTGRAARTRAEAQYLEAKSTLAALVAESVSRLRTARAAVAESRARVEYLRDVVVPRRRRIVALTTLQHNAMLAGAFQLLQARQNQAQAEGDAIEAERDYWSARADLDAVLFGVSDPPMPSGDREPGTRRQSRRGGH